MKEFSINGTSAVTKLQLKSILKVPLIEIHYWITFECNQCKRTFTEKVCLKTHTRFVNYMIQFLPWCDKCPFKGKTQENLQSHILWIHEGKGLQCELCDYRPTQKSAMTKHMELKHRQLTKYKEPSFSICIECGLTSVTKAGLDKHITCFTQGISLSVVNIVEKYLPRKFCFSSTWDLTRLKSYKVSALWESIH